MEFFEVEGTALFHWKMTVAAADEDEAARAVGKRVAACVGAPGCEVTLGGLEHRVVRCQQCELEEAG
jgi:hypothetical protein